MVFVYFPNGCSLPGRKDKENAKGAKSGAGSKLLLVQPSRVVMFVPGCGVRPFYFTTVCDGQTTQRDVYQRVAQDAVVFVKRIGGAAKKQSRKKRR